MQCGDCSLRGSSGCRARALGCVGFSRFGSGLNSCSSRALELRLIAVAHGVSYFAASGTFPDWGSNLSPALAARFFTTEPPRMP